jgi:myo-inositol-1(or 4)-monophosphatase
VDSDAIGTALEEARGIAEEAAALVLDGFRSGAVVHKKGPVDLVTEFDLKSEALIRRRLLAAFPGHAIVGEEGEPVGSGDLVWYVDPLDGTTNFAHGHPFFAVSIGLCDGSAPLVGVVHAPAIGVTWTAARGFGTRRNGAPCSVSPTTSLGDALCATGFPYDRRTNSDNNIREYEAFLRRTQGVRRCGSASIDLALVADGSYDLSWEQRLSPWDLAAGACLVAEAGGRLSDYQGGPADPRSGMLVATNGALHEATLEVLVAARAGI